MNDINDNGISGENEELIRRIAGMIKKDKENKAIEAMVGERIASTDFGSIPTEEDKVHRFAGWQKYAAIAAVLVIGGLIGIRMLEENRNVTKKNESIANAENQDRLHTEAEPAMPAAQDTTTVLAETEMPATDEAVPGEPAAEPMKKQAEAPVATTEQFAAKDRGTGELKSYRSSVESAKEQNLGGAVVSNERSNRSIQEPGLFTKSEMKPGMPSPKVYGNVQDTIRNYEDIALTDKKKSIDDDEESSITRSLGNDALMKNPSKKEIGQYMINPGDGLDNTEKIKHAIISVLQSYGYQNLNISEKEYYVQIKTEPSEGFSSKLGKNVNYSIEVKINKSLLGGISVKLLNLLEDGKQFMNKTIVPIEDLFNKSIKNSLNKALSK